MTSSLTVFPEYALLCLRILHYLIFNLDHKYPPCVETSHFRGMKFKVCSTYLFLILFDLFSCDI